MYFLTLVSASRRPIFSDDAARGMLRQAIEEAQSLLPFTLVASVLMPEHLHVMMRLPEGQSDYPCRVSKIKRNFTARFLAQGGVEAAVRPGKARQRYRGVWQPRFMEHTIRDYRDYKLHLDYIHANPVKHALVAWPRDWPWSTFHGYVKKGEYAPDWCGHIELPGGVDIEPQGWA